MEHRSNDFCLPEAEVKKKTLGHLFKASSS